MAAIARPRRARPLRVGDRTLSISGETTDVADALHAYDETYLDCRDLRHAWVRQGFWAAGGEVHRRLVCSRCTTVRLDTWSHDGYNRGHNRYEYPDGYVLSGAHARPADVRHEAIERATVYATEDSMMESLFSRRRQA